MEIDWITLDRLSIGLGLLSTIFAAAAAMFSGWQGWSARREKKRLNNEIFIRLRNKKENKIIAIPFALRRRELTRSEVLGLIGMLPMKSELKRFRFAIGYLSTCAFREELSRVQDSCGEDTLAIDCTQSELDQFDMEKFNSENRN